MVGQGLSEVQTWLAPRSDASMRARQIFRWIYQKRAGSFEEMTDLPADLRTELSTQFRIDPLSIGRHVVSRDGVHKLLVHGGDEQSFECVLLPFEDRVSCCLSSQVGCPMGCKFCATGLGGYDRDLTPQEIVSQFVLLQRLTDRRISHLVMMGMGEPLLNLAHVVEALRFLHEHAGISYRRMTLSTVGIVPKIRELAELELPIHLALSLHSPIDRIRDTLMPVNKRWPVNEVVQAMKDYQARTGRKITVEYLLIAGVTDTEEQAERLASLFRGVPHVVNLIPYNAVSTDEGFARPKPEAIRKFRRVLESRRVQVTQRVERGHDVAAACGQLAGEHQGRFARRSKSSGLPVSA